MSSRFKFLISPLDWGLGHTTRCLPIIGYLLREGHEVTVASPPRLSHFIRQYFPDIKVLPIKGYNITYSKNASFFTLKILIQIPKILRAIRREHRWLLQQESFDYIISDNRYGLYHPGIPSVIMTHQLRIQSGKGALINRLLQYIHYRLLRRFDQCWVVDTPGDPNLGGALSHPKHLPQHASYIGLLSQLSLFPPVHPPPVIPDSKQKLLILLSGPEPMREILEQELATQCLLIKDTYRITFVAGKQGGTANRILKNAGIRYETYLTGQQLYPLLVEADLVICRSGYSSLMDLAYLGKKALLIPTPGQTEQAYLARYLHQQFFIQTTRQGRLKLAVSVPQALSAPPLQAAASDSLLFIKAINSLLQRSDTTP